MYSQGRELLHCMKSLVAIIVLSSTWTIGMGQELKRYPIQKMNWDLGFIDENGKEIYTGPFDILEEYHSGLAFFKKGNKRGYLDEHGKVVFTSKFAWSSFSEGLLKYRDDQGFYYLNTRGKIQIDLSKLPLPAGKEIFDISDFHEGLALVRIQNVGTENFADGRSDIAFDESFNQFPGNWCYGFIGRDGTWVVQPTLESATGFKDGYSVVVVNQERHLMNRAGLLVMKLQPGAGGYSEGFAEVFEEDGIYFINTKGTRLGSGKFEKAEPFSEGMAAVELNGKWGFIDSTGNVVVEPKYFIESTFSEGIAPVSLRIQNENGLGDSYFIEGFIDKKGNVVLPFERDVDYEGFRSRLTRGRRFINTNHGRYTGTYELFYMDRSGRKVWSEVVKQNR